MMICAFGGYSKSNATKTVTWYTLSRFHIAFNETDKKIVKNKLAPIAALVTTWKVWPVSLI